MKRRLHLAIFAAAFVASVFPAGAQQTSPLQDPARIAAARDLLIAMGSDAQFDAVIGTMTRQMAVLFKQQQPAHAAAIDEVFSLLGKRFVERKQEVIEMVAPLYAEKFTAEELREITAFYATPIGRKLVQELPGLTQRGVLVGMRWGQKIGEDVEREAREELKKRGIPL